MFLAHRDERKMVKMKNRMNITLLKIKIEAQKAQAISILS